MKPLRDLVDRLNAALAGRYELQRRIGEGGMAIVFLAQDLKHDRPVAVKVLRPDLSATIGADRFLREIQISAKLNHPHILTLIDSGEAAGLLYYVMPYVEGESLRQKMEREGQLPLDEAFRIVREVADGLGYAHRLDIIHRDIKPENVLLSEGHAIVTDFGIAKAVTVAGGRITKTGGSVGSPLYMSPEQSAGSTHLDSRSDLYSLACMLFEMLAGEPPFTGQSVQALIAKHAMEPPPDVRVLRPSVPEPVGSAIRKALSKTPADRFKRVGDLSVLLSGTAASAEAEPWDRAETPPLGKRVITPSAITVRGRRGWLVLLLGGALVGSTVLGVLKTTRAGLEPRAQVEGVWTPGVQVEHRQITFSGDVQSAALSPDGSFLVFRKMDPVLEEPTPGLFLTRAVPGGEERLLTEREAWGPRWTPDGTEILFFSPAGNGAEEGIYAVPVAGGQARWIGPGAYPIAISPDGARLVRRLFFDFQFVTSDDRNTLILSRIDNASRYDTLAMPGAGYISGIEWSPSGRELLIYGVRVVRGPRDDFRYFMEVRAPDGALQDSVLGGEFIEGLAWVPGGRAVLFSSRDTLRLAGLGAGEEVIGPVDQFKDIPVRSFSLSSNGRRLAYVQRGGTEKLMVAEVLGGGQLGEPQVVGREFGENALHWPVFSPDERQIAFTLGRFISVAQLSGGVMNTVVRVDQRPDNLSWSADGSTLGFSTWDSSTGVSTLSTVPSKGGPLEILGTVESLGTITAAGKGLWISYTGDSLFYLPRRDTIPSEGWGENDLGSQPNRILWTDGRLESFIPLAPQRIEHWGTLGPNGLEWISVAPEGFTVLSLSDGSVVREIPLVPPDLPGPHPDGRRVGSIPEDRRGDYYLGPVGPLVWTSDDWIYFRYEFPPSDDSEYYAEFWRVRADGVGGGVPEPALLNDDGSPKRFSAGSSPIILSAQANYVSWIERESSSDVLIAEVSPRDGRAP